MFTVDYDINAKEAGHRVPSFFLSEDFFRWEGPADHEIQGISKFLRCGRDCIFISK